MSSFEGRIATVTGGGSGLGEAIGKDLATRGVKVVLSDIDLDAAERVAREIRDAGGQAVAIEQDTAKPEDSQKVVQSALDTYGALHYAVNNAGIGGSWLVAPVRFGPVTSLCSGGRRVVPDSPTSKRAR